MFSDVFLKSSQALLREATSAAEFAEADLTELTSRLEHTSRGRLGRSQAEAVQAAARDSLGLTKLGGVASFELLALLDQIAFLEQQVAAVEREIEALVGTLEQHLTDIKGLGPVLAAACWPRSATAGRQQSYDPAPHPQAMWWRALSSHLVWSQHACDCR